jgi:hypothetical protein
MSDKFIVFDWSSAMFDGIAVLLLIDDIDI